MGERLINVEQEIRKVFKTKKNFAEAVGWEPSKVTKAITGQQPWSDSDITIAARALGLSIPTMARLVKRSAFLIVDDDVEVGALSDFISPNLDDPKFHWRLPRPVFSSCTDSLPASVKWLKVSDDTMAPAYNRDDYVIVDTGLARLRQAGDYVIDTGVGLEIRTISVSLGKNRPTIELRCGDPTASPIVMNYDDVCITGRIVGHFRRR